MRYTGFFPYSLFPIPYSLFPIPYYLKPGIKVPQQIGNCYTLTFCVIFTIPF
ncbi:MAG: hypothetical protein F6J94_03145 [Moorea sp. SIO1F2]|uniref:hypothetical protein n=1 Tax=Moorena sp. SIO1F2 TaxID=2607819 RepID=UPI0013B905C6|nr:hypothetical protein [Moorena sp. SIO1F2]NET81005.1 hypothetical protein [Moorena sp. SIO1F2]